jgi:hypothetical protein
MKFFNTAGPVNQPNHYKIDPLERWDLDEVLMLIAQRKYFILHAPRQTGKTSSLLALEKKLNSEGDYFALYTNFEVGQASRNNIEDAVKGIITEISQRVSSTYENLAKQLIAIAKEQNFNSSLNYALTEISKACGKPFILLIDEIDSLVGDTLISVLRQIRAGYDKRPSTFPSAIILCGVRDIKDYRIQTSGKDIITGGSAFNIKAKSLRMGNFSKEEVVKLYQQHTNETGQKFDEDCFELVWRYTYGQPWLVNALGYEVTFEMIKNRDRSIAITKDMMEEAKNRLVVSRATHLDQLIDKLKEERVYNLINPMIMGYETRATADDEEYCVDLGLIRKTKEGFIISNEIYREVIPRELTSVIQGMFLSKFKPDWVDSRGVIDSKILISMFRQFWRENSDIWSRDIAGYKEAAPHLTFQGFLQRVANGDGYVAREYGLSRRRVDLMLRWSCGDSEQRIVIELKIRTEKESSEDSLEKLIESGLEQTFDYSTISDATESHLIIFDRREGISWDEKIYEKEYEYKGRKIKVWGM